MISNTYRNLKQYTYRGISYIWVIKSGNLIPMLRFSHKSFNLLIFVLPALMFLSIQKEARSQDYNTTLGIKLMPAVSTLYERGYESYYYGKNNKNIFPRFSFNAGIEVRNRIDKKPFYVQLGLFYMNKGASGNVIVYDSFNAPVDTARYRYDEYLFTLPVSLIFKYKAFYAGIGANMSYHYLVKVSSDDYPTYKAYEPLFVYLYGGQFLMGFEKFVGKNILLSFEGNLNMIWLRNYWMATYGLGIGVKYVFNK
jgi:hypothetical protein